VDITLGALFVFPLLRQIYTIQKNGSNKNGIVNEIYIL